MNNSPFLGIEKLLEEHPSLSEVSSVSDSTVQLRRKEADTLILGFQLLSTSQGYTYCHMQLLQYQLHFASLMRATTVSIKPVKETQINEEY